MVAVVLGALSTAAAAQQAEGVIVVARDVPERYAFLPGSGEALTVKTAPFVEVWAGINPGRPISNSAADAIAARTTSRNPRLQYLGSDFATALRLETNPSVSNQSNSQRSGVGTLVGQAIDGGMGSLRSGLDQMQSALRP
jgi:hypothetical protein